MEWENIFANDAADKRLVSKIYKELLKLNTQETNKQIKKWTLDSLVNQTLKKQEETSSGKRKSLQ